MVTDKQKRLCMRFADGKLFPSDPPGWFAEHLNSGNDDWQQSLHNVGCLSMETFDGSDTYEIYRSPNGFLIDYTDVFESAGWIFIDHPSDYLTFRATMLAPLVMLTMQSDRHALWVQERDAKNRAAGVR